MNLYASKIVNAIVVGLLTYQLLATPTSGAVGKQAPESPTVTLTYIAGVTPQAEQAFNRDLSNLHIYRSSCAQISWATRRENMADQIINKNNLIVPFVFQELKNRLGSVNVVFDPAIVELSPEGKLVLRTSAEQTLTKRRAFFMAYSDPCNVEASTQGNWLISVLSDLPAPATSGLLVDWAAARTEMFVPKNAPSMFTSAKTMAVYGSISGSSFNHMMAFGPGTINGEIVTKSINKWLAGSRKQALTWPSCVKTYNLILSVPNLSEELCMKMLQREIVFRDVQAKPMIDLITTGEYGASLRQTAIAEHNLERQAAVGSLIGMLGAVGTNGTGLTTAGSVAQIAQNMSSTMAITQKVKAASADALAAADPLSKAQARSGSAITANIDEINAVNLAELRQDFIEIAKAQHRQ